MSVSLALMMLMILAEQTHIHSLRHPLLYAIPHTVNKAINRREENDVFLHLDYL